MNTVEITICNRLRDIARASGLVDSLAAEHRLSSDAVSKIHVALDEMLSNIIKYGYDDGRLHEIRVRLSVADDMFVAEIEDDGKPFNPLTAPMPDVEVPLAERTVGGLGIHIVRHLMNELEYSRVDAHNRLIMRKRLGPASRENPNGSS